MSTRHPAPAEACAPDPNRAGPAAPGSRPDWLIHLIALVIRYILARTLASHTRPTRLPPWWHAWPDLPPASAQALAASVRGAFGNAIAWMCLRRGIGPGHKDWPALSRAIVAYGGSLRRFRPGMPPLGLQWWEHPGIIPGMHAEIRPTPAADAMQRLLARQDAALAPPSPRPGLPAEPEPTGAPAFRPPVPPRAATGPPAHPATGPPHRRRPQSLCDRSTGPEHGWSRHPDSSRRPARPNPRRLLPAVAAASLSAADHPGPRRPATHAAVPAARRSHPTVK